jgi:hypothetical protein
MFLQFANQKLVATFVQMDAVHGKFLAAAFGAQNAVQIHERDMRMPRLIPQHLIIKIHIVLNPG